MRLKRIKLAGFKSFVDPTSIPFPDDMTAIVGPNGCGKSNVIDAVRWVLGESSAKNLRGDAMTDVIFNGSSARKPVSQCSVELVFDNTSGRIQGEYANYNELSVKRLVTRDGQSNYFLNASKCRRRDVTDLFLGTGLGPRSYAIIEQGMISRLIESKPQELRVFIEEAAGISKYKERRRETENRIRHTKENLERLEDVRGELGLQLEKLQRQANAARRYKELKAKERKYKAELAAVRWLKHSNHISSLEQDIAKQEADIEAFVAQQRGDEKGLTEHREQQAELKQKLADVQQAYFKVGTEITRLEQNQIHAKQRRQQIEQELRSLLESIEDSDIHQQQEAERIEQLQEQIGVGEPEQVLLEEQLEQAQSLLMSSEQALVSHENQWRTKEQEFLQLKQQIQAKHGQIQSTMNMQMRTQQRLGELRQELGDLEHDLLAEQISGLKEQVEVAVEQYEQAKTLLDSADKQQTESIAHQRQLEQSNLKANGQLQTVQAEISALENMQVMAAKNEKLDQYLADNGVEYQSFWQSLDVVPGWEEAVEVVASHWQQAKLINQHLSQQTLAQMPAASLLLVENMTTVKPKGSLAEMINNDLVPVWFADIQVVDTFDLALEQQKALQGGKSLVTQDGLWLGKDWITTGKVAASDSGLKRASRLRELLSDKLEQELEVNELALKLQEAQSETAKLKQQWQSASDNFKHSEQALTQEQNQLNLLEMQHQQSVSRQSRIHQELEKQQHLLEEEKLQSEELAMQVEELEMSLGEMEHEQHDMESNKESLQLKVEQGRAQVEQIKNKSHQLALQLQAVKSQYQSLTDSHQRQAQQLQQMQQRHQQLIEENAQLSMPMEEQAGRLEELLEQRLLTENEQNGISNQLADVEAFISDAEKGQQGIMDKIQQMRGTLESLKLECEGYRVRANGVLEQLQEMQQPLKPILESLPEEANESQWQQELEKTSASISRLGAVNLAAVEEYEVQAERKQHLDDQNEDLTSALETLEAAIRKIDKETRSRFKDTFEKVNNDLKGLFPKVFGGGSAYLELTDDDLLETGVAIMARPPGKKNSTIHLLSGGEKALTALSLVFAIFRLNPAPFCLLDEVDAPLDDANVGRFCKLVSEMSKSVQFIYITHNKIAMEMATHLTGVTMAEPGVSRMVAVDVDEAVAIAHA